MNLDEARAVKAEAKEFMATVGCVDSPGIFTYPALPPLGPVPAAPLPVTKDTNPKDAVGTAKVPLSTVSAPVMAELGLAMLEGARKYGRHNYRVSGVRASVYYDAALRHLMAFYEGEDIDPDSELPHLVKAMACLAVLRDSQIQGNWVDDRPPKSPDGWIARLNEAAAKLIEKYPDAKPAHVAFEEPPKLTWTSNLAKAGFGAVCETLGVNFEKVGPTNYEARVPIRDYVDYIDKVDITVDSLDNADHDYVWENHTFRFRWSDAKYDWQISSLPNPVTDGWISMGTTPSPSIEGPYKRAQSAAETF